MDGYIFKKMRTDQKLTLFEVSMGTGLEPATINKIENGKNKSPSFPLVKRLAVFFNLDMNLI